MTAPVRASGRLGSRVVWSALSQGASSATNLGLVAGLTVLAPPDELGRLVVAPSITLLAVTVSRALLTDPLVAAAGTPEARSWRQVRAGIVRLALVATALGAAVGLHVGLGAGALLLLVAPMPILLVQDGQRVLAWATGRPGLALVLDLTWLAAGAAIAAGGVVGRGLDPVTVMAAWAGGGVVSWLVGRSTVERDQLQRTAPAPEGGRRPAVAAQSGSDAPIAGGEPPGADRFRALAVSQAVHAGAFNLLPVVAALVVAPAAAATVKALLLPFAPVLSLMAGLRVVTLPMIRRAVDAGPAAARRAVSRLVTAGMVASVVVALATVAAVGAVPDGSLGPSLASVRPLLPWGAALSVTYVAAQVLADARALAGRPGSVLARRVVTIAIEWCCLLGGALLGGTAGLAVGWAVGLAVATMAWLPSVRPSRSGPVRPI